MDTVIDSRHAPDGAEPPPAPAAARPRGSRDGWIYLFITLATLGVWALSRLNLFKAGDDVGYWIAVVGGLMMLALLSYPLRKYVKAFSRLGSIKVWFLVHMMLGICGPLLILLHSNFSIGSLNAGVALWSMVVVALSGVVGRFLHVRVHRGLQGELTSLRDLQARAGLDREESKSRLSFAPKVEARLKAFDAAANVEGSGLLLHLRQALLLPPWSWIVFVRCLWDLEAPLRRIARHRQWTRQDLALRRRLSRKLVHRTMLGIVRVAQYTAYERLFAFWHVAHVPFVWLLALSAAVHVFAVHAY